MFLPVLCSARYLSLIACQWHIVKKSNTHLSNIRHSVTKPTLAKTNKENGEYLYCVFVNETM